MDLDSSAFKQEKTFQATISSDNQVCSGIAYIYFSKHFPDKIRIELKFFEKDFPLIQRMCFNRGIEISGQLAKQQVKISNFHFTELSQNQLLGYADAILICDIEEKVETIQGNYNIRIKLPLLKLGLIHNMKIVSMTGEVKYALERNENDGIKWEENFGTCVLADFYEYDKVSLGIKKGTLQTQGCEIFIHSDFHGTLDINQILDSVKKESKDWLLLLSFLSRKHLHFYSIEVQAFYETEESKNNFAELTLWESVNHPNRDYFEEEPILMQHVLADSQFENLVKNFKLLSFKDVLEKVIIYTVSSYEEKLDLHSQFLFAYTALELLVNFLSGKKKDKFLRKLMALIDKYEVNVEDLFRWNIFDPSDGFSQMINRRNLLIHEGKVEDYEDMYCDLMRLRILCERFILIILNCPIDVINEEAYRRNLRYLRVGSYY